MARGENSSVFSDPSPLPPPDMEYEPDIPPPYNYLEACRKTESESERETQRERERERERERGRVRGEDLRPTHIDIFLGKSRSRILRPVNYPSGL